MPTLSQAEQRSLGAQLAAIAEPLPRDQRLLLYVAAFYGEARAQGLSPSQASEFAVRTIRIHERGLLPAHLVFRESSCPTCGGAL